jgi:hypothetical protein
MHHPPQPQPTQQAPRDQPPLTQQEPPTPGLLSQSDPQPERPTRRPPIWLIVIVLLVAGVILMHVAGVGPSH